MYYRRTRDWAGPLGIAALLVLLCSDGIAAQRTFRIATGVIGGTRMSAGEDLTVVVAGLNPFCYSGLTATLEPVEGKLDTKSFIGSFSPTQTPQKTELPPTVPPPPPAGGGAGGRPGPAEVALEDASNAIRRAGKSFNEATEALASAKLTSDRAAPIIQAVDKPPCELGPAWDGGSLLREWGAVRSTLVEELVARRAALPAIRVQLTSGETELRAAEAALAKVDAGTHRSRRESLVEQLGAERERLAALRRAESAVAANLPVQADAMRRINPQYSAFESAVAQQWTVMAEATQETENAKLTINLVPRPGTSAQPREIVQQFRVERRYRSFFSTGVLVTGLPQPSYERVTRLAGEDSTYQTYADRHRGVLSTFSPSVQYNLSFFEPADGASMLASFGVAVRSVRDQLLPEPFTGLSLGLIDRFVVTGGVHIGRRQELLITRDGEDPEDVEKRTIPDEITAAEAIGIRWKPALFFSISLKT